jgi:hypothetical protein
VAQQSSRTPTSARHGLSWYEVDVNWIGISTLRFSAGVGRQGREGQAAVPYEENDRMALPDEAVA